MRHQNEHSKRVKLDYITRSKSQPYNKHFLKLSYFVSFLQIAGLNNTDIDWPACSSSSGNIRPWNVESLESTNNSPLALVQGVAKATVQINRGMREREQRELEREQLQRDQDRREAEIRMRGNREMIERERREIRRSSGWREWQEAVPRPWCSCLLDEVTNMFRFFFFFPSKLINKSSFLALARGKLRQVLSYLNKMTQATNDGI